MTATITTSEDREIRFAHVVRPYWGESEDMNVIEASDEDDRIVGELYTDLTTGQIMQVEVTADRQREGIAVGMAAFAEGLYPVFHSPDEHCTPEGLAFKIACDGDEIPAHLAYNPA